MDYEKCLTIALVLLLLPSVAFALSVMSRSSDRTSAPPSRHPPGYLNKRKGGDDS